MYYTFKNFDFKVNKNIIYLCCKCYIRNDGIEKFYKKIETNKVFDLSKDLSKIKINYNKSEMLLIEQLDYQKYANYIFIFVPDDRHVIVIPVEGIASVFDNSLIDFIYNNTEICIDKINNYIYNEHDKSLDKNDLDIIKTYLDEIQTLVLKKFNKRRK